MPQDKVQETTTVGTNQRSDGRPNLDRRNEDRPHDERYNPQGVESKWFERWQSDPRLYAADAADSSKKKY